MNTEIERPNNNRQVTHSSVRSRTNSDPAAAIVAKRAPGVKSDCRPAGRDPNWRNHALEHVIGLRSKAAHGGQRVLCAMTRAIYDPAQDTCWPSDETLAKILKISARGVRKQIRILIDLGELQDLGRHPRYRTRVRRICCLSGGTKVPPNQETFPIPHDVPPVKPKAARPAVRPESEPARRAAPEPAKKIERKRKPGGAPVVWEAKDQALRELVLEKQAAAGNVRNLIQQIPGFRQGLETAGHAWQSIYQGIETTLGNALRRPGADPINGLGYCLPEIRRRTKYLAATRCERPARDPGTPELPYADDPAARRAWLISIGALKA